MSEEYVILVDEHDNELGVMEKMQAHVEGKLHRAISIVIINSKKELLLQQRAYHKYHSAGLWTNTCCTHPKQGETPEITAHRRLHEEMGMTCELEYKFNFIYHTTLANQLIENELDYLYVGMCDTLPIINPNEVAAYRYASIKDIENDLKENPQQYTVWFKLIFDKIKHSI